MRANHSIRQSISVGIIFFFIFGLLFPSIGVQAIQTDGNDGFWTDNFAVNDTTIRTNCTWINEAIRLNSGVDDGRAYDFKDGGSYKNNAHEAYYYWLFSPRALPNLRTFLLLFHSPSKHVGESEFYDPIGYQAIEQDDSRYVETKSKSSSQCVIHHFRFKLGVAAESIGNLTIYWFGKTAENAKIDLYYWGYQTELKKLPTWHQLPEVQSNTSKMMIRYNLTQEEAQRAVNEDNYFDFLVVAQSEDGLTTLSTDYVKVVSHLEEGYKVGHGHAMTVNWIEPRTITSGLTRFSWESLQWEDYEKVGATVTYQVYYSDSKGNTSLVSEEYLKGNKDGFTQSPLDLSSVPTDLVDKIKIKANLSTTTPAASPKIFRWTVTWQKAGSWQDLFNSDYRIDEKTRVTIEGGSVNITAISGDWPMFGQNTGNTRASEGKGAQTNNLYWWSTLNQTLIETIYDPVISGDTMYLSAETVGAAGKIYKYHPIYKQSDTPLTPILFKDLNQIPVSSPAIVDDYVIVATGTTSSDGARNYIYGFKTNGNAAWPSEFDFGDDICYWASPTVTDDKIFITSWSGDPDPLLQNNKNNYVIALKLSNGQSAWDSFYELPAGSFSTPAVANNMVFVGCKNNRGDSFFALDATTGTMIWNQSIGAVGRSSPVIDNNTVYIVSEDNEKLLNSIATRTKVTALNINDGAILWKYTTGKRAILTPPLSPTFCLADSTPALYNGILYVTSPDGWVYALNSADGKEIWSQQVYSKLTGPIFSSSPAYADGLVYVGTPDGYIYALEASTNGTTQWSRQTYPTEQANAVSTSPIVSNGLVFYGAANGILYSCGSYVSPTDQIEGRLISYPISLPQGYWWNKFYADYLTDADQKINKITFTLLDVNKNPLLEIHNQSAVLVPNRTLDRTLRLQAYFWAKNSSVNPQLDRWYMTFIKDKWDPKYDIKSFTPDTNGWLKTIIPAFTVKVKDNTTGLRINSARYVLEYTMNNKTYTTDAEQANCTGIDGTTETQTITADISTLDFFDNITNLQKITISIQDLAGNTNSTTVNLKMDNQKPKSWIIAKTLNSRYNASFVIYSYSKDVGRLGVNASGIRNVTLYYRQSPTNNVSGPWKKYETSLKQLPRWTFNYSGDGGYIEFWTIAIDNASNMQDFPIEHSNISILYDGKKPSLPAVSGETIWFKDRPEFTVDFSDDYLLDTIRYRLNLDTYWTNLASDIHKKTYTANWQLSQTAWDQMEDGDIYYVYLWINDTLNNIQLLADNTNAISIRKDAVKPQVNLELPQLETEWSTSKTINVTAITTDRNGSGIKQVTLYYRFSEDNNDWGNWTQYNDTLSSPPFNWEFTAPDGNGYYEFKIVAEDRAGNIAESAVATAGINSFPGDLVLVMVGLIVILLLISTGIFMKWRKKKE